MDIQLTQILFQIINFSVVVGALTFLLYKPVLKIFDERAKRIEEGQKAAEKAIKSIDALDQEKKKAESDLKKERTRILNAARKEAMKESDDFITKVHKETSEEQKKLLEKWGEEKAQLLKEARSEMTDAVIAISAKVIGETLDKKTQQQLIDKELNLIIKNI